MQEITPIEIEQVSGATGAQEIAKLTEQPGVFNHDWKRPPEER